ncbi:hypothetical protein QTP70_022160, partial [Hemibagrus guttatus]
CRRQWWDHGKVLIQQLCRECTVSITRDITKSLKDLEIGIVELQAVAESTGDRRHVEDLKVKKALMADLLGTKVQGALIRSRFKGVNEMDAPSKYFFGLEKKNGQSRFIHTLHTGNGQYIAHTDEIRRYATDFYQDLYRSEHRDNKELLDTFYQGLPKVSSEDNAALEGPLVLEAALNTMPGGKAPGIDGLPVEFYKFFWKELGEDLLEVLEESCRERCLPLSSRRVVITLLPKKGDLQDIKNWRPVSLLCADYKIMSKALANRLRDIMDSVIPSDLTYCVHNRSIIDNVSLIRDILDVSRSLAVDLGLISLDQEKAFDRVEQYLWKTLEAFGLSPSLIAMMKVLSQDVESVLKINGGLSAPFKVQRGIRQGCSLSAWTLFKRGSQGPAVFLYWLLEEPLVGGGCMDVKDSSPGLTHITHSKKFTTLRRLVDTAGPEFKDTRAVAEELGLRCVPANGVTVEEVLLGIGKEIGYDSISSASHMNKVVVVFVKEESHVSHLTNVGIVVSGEFVLVSPLIAPTVRVTVSNVPPFIPNGEIERGLTCYGKLASAIRTVPLGCKNGALKHVMSFRRHVFMFLNEQELDVWFRVGYEGRTYMVYASTVRAMRGQLGWGTEEETRQGDKEEDGQEIEEEDGQEIEEEDGQEIEEEDGQEIEEEDGQDGGVQQSTEGDGRLNIEESAITDKVAREMEAKLQEELFNTLPISYRTYIGQRHGTTQDRKIDEEFPGLRILPAERTEEDDAVTDSILSFKVPQTSLKDTTTKGIYHITVKVLHKESLKRQKASRWPGMLNPDFLVWDRWRTLYKPPVEKRTADLQWRIIHGAVATDGHVAHLNPAVKGECGFCGQKEDLEHLVLKCQRL